jgi:hypothetical protein
MPLTTLGIAGDIVPRQSIHLSRRRITVAVRFLSRSHTEELIALRYRSVNHPRSPRFNTLRPKQLLEPDPELPYLLRVPVNRQVVIVVKR